MPLHIRPLETQDYAAATALIHETAPERAESAAMWPQGEEQTDEDDYASRFFVGVNGDKIIGYGATWPQREGRFRLDLMVAPTWRRQGIGNALLEHLLQALYTQKAAVVQARTPDDRAESLEFLLKRGFTETNRMARLRLNVTETDLKAFQPVVSALTAQGITTTTLVEEQARTPDYRHRLQELIRATMPGRADPYRRELDSAYGSDEDAARILQSYDPLSPGAFFIARHGSEYIGLSYLEAKIEAREVFQGDTAVHAGWRRHGIATALKLQTIVYARKQGYTAISTNTANPAMYALNQKLGFQPLRAEIRLVKRLDVA